MKDFTIYKSDCLGVPSNCTYSESCHIRDETSLLDAVSFDHVTARYIDNYRKAENFIEADCICLDCDNDHSDAESDWVEPVDVALAMPGVQFVSVTSRSNNKEKGGKTARPRFHVIFPIEITKDPDAYQRLKKGIELKFPFFDKNAMDAARFYFGNPDAEIEFYEGDTTIDEYLGDEEFEEHVRGQSEIQEGSRNSTMSKYAAKVIKRLGDTDDAYEQFLKEAEKCTPPLPEYELKTIWASARKFWQTKVSSQEDYVAPENYKSGLMYKPKDLTDVGQAEVAAAVFSDTVKYSPETGYIVYNGVHWEEDNVRAHAKIQELTALQLKEAKAEREAAIKDLMAAGIYEDVKALSAKKAEEQYGTNEKFKRYIAAEGYFQFVLKRRESKFITAALKEFQPLCYVDPEDLDKNEILLNTPSATFDLRFGWDRPMEHNPADLITKVTGVDPGTKGKDIWEDALNLFFQGDAELIRYVQNICGLAAIGKVYMEAIIISYGSGRNGKSTLWNAISRVLGTYSGGISADVFTANCKRNVKPELAETKGKRLLIAAELEESMRLSTSLVKQLCSTDKIQGEKKYKAPIRFEPSHTLILHTNFLPRVGVIDEGTWRRLIVVPFNAVIEGNDDIKNYAQYLFDNAGEAILAWIMEGSKRVIEADFHIEMPEAVKSVTAAYRERNDWLAQFIEECCELGEGLRAPSGAVYDEYRSNCLRTGEFARNTAEFYSSISSLGITRKRTKEGSFLIGIKLKDESLT